MDASLTFEQVIDFLLDAPLFERLDPAGLADVARLMRVRRLRAGAVLFEQGTEGDAWYVIYEGEARVARADADGVSHDVADLRVRACFGEMAVLDDSPRSASVRAVTDLTVLEFSRSAFQQLWDDRNPAAHELVLAMAKVLCERQRRLTAELQVMVEDCDSEHSEEIGALVDHYRVSE
ncbi:MAG: cyclic nucleotide-binding domain-containing protein [Alphaproteobacteria bacterium]|nr:cyclic nucleotide-binding domain-containing protein [Alphaproteobacteria bacterium]